MRKARSVAMSVDGVECRSMAEMLEMAAASG